MSTDPGALLAALGQMRDLLDAHGRGDHVGRVFEHCARCGKEQRDRAAEARRRDLADTQAALHRPGRLFG